MCLNTWNPSFGAACHRHGFAPLACGRMTPALAKAGFQISVFHVLAAIAFPYFVVSTRLNSFPSPARRISMPTAPCRVALKNVTVSFQGLRCGGKFILTKRILYRSAAMAP